MRKTEFIIILVITCAVIIVWVIADIAHTKPSETVPAEVQSDIEPLTPTCDQEVLDKIAKTPPNSLVKTQAPPSPSPSPSPSLLVLPSPSTLNLPSPLQEATQSSPLIP